MGQSPLELRLSSESRSITNTGMRLNYEFSRNSAEVARETLPKPTRSSASKHVLEADMSVLKMSNWQGKLSLGFRYVAQDKSSIDCYSRGSVVLGGSCDEADFRLFDVQNYEQSEELFPSCIYF